MSARWIEERTYYPTGCDPDRYEAAHFGVKVTWRGRGRWGVFQGSEYRQFTHTGRLLYCPRRLTQMRWCQFTFEDACALAERVVDGAEVNGHTWAEWESWRERRRQEVK